MKITSFSIKRPVTIFMSILVVLMFGVVSYFKLNLDMFPEIELPMLMIMTQQHGAGPEEIEENITKPLEQVLATVSNMESINSVSSEGSSMIMIQFADGTNMDFSALDIREKVDMIKPMLPEGIVAPMIMKLDPSSMPIMNFGVGFKGYDVAKLSEWSEKVLKPSIERVDGVAAVDITGSVSNEVKIIVNHDKLSAYGLNLNSIMTAIKGNNLNVPIGNIQEGDYELLVRTTNKLTDLSDIEEVPLNTSEGKVIKLSDVATIEMGYSNIKGYSKINGEDALMVSIQKESNANTVKVSREINRALEKLINDNEEAEITTIMDQAEFIEFVVDSVKMNAIIGGVLAILILLLFLKDLRTTLIMAASIPICVISTFILVYFAGLTLNMISLGGIALGIGMLVDNSIVVIENIYRLKKEGLSNSDASIKGTSEVGTAITASTLTSICVFLPIVFVQGMAADIFKEMALTVTFSLVSSLVVSFTLVPLLACKLLNEKSLNKENKTVNKLKGLYYKVLEWSLVHKRAVFAMLIVSIFIGGLAFSVLGIELFPQADQGIVMIDVKGPKGSTSESIQSIAEQVIRKVKNIEEIETNSIMTNGDTSSIYLILKDSDERKRSDLEVSNEVRNLVKDIAGAKIEVKTSGSMMSMGSSPLVIKIAGEDFEVLDEISSDLVDIMNGIGGITNIQSSNEKNADEIRLIIDKEKSAYYGLSTGMVAQSVQGYFRKNSATTINMQGEKFDIVVAPVTSINPTLSDIESIVITNQMGGKIPLKDIATIERGEGYSQISRFDQVREVTVSSGVSGRALGDVVNDIEDKLKNYDIPEGYKITFGGEVEQMKEAFSQLILALVLAILLVYMVMAAQFESFLNPFIIMFTMPLAFVGAILALFIANVSIGITTMIGFLMLAGIIVNNGIVLVDYINRLKSEGLSTKEAILKAGPTRLQPILMTALTTIVGLVPMALGVGKGAELQMPMALTVIGGLAFATVLTLIVIPVIYYVFDIIKVNIKLKRA